MLSRGLPDTADQGEKVLAVSHGYHRQIMPIIGMVIAFRRPFSLDVS